jgi:hypothetical protein
LCETRALEGPLCQKSNFAVKLFDLADTQPNLPASGRLHKRREPVTSERSELGWLESFSI